LPKKLIVEAYDPVHPENPEMQVAAGILIDVLITKGDLFNERFATVTYGNLRDKKSGIDQEHEEIAMGAYNFAHVILRLQRDLIFAEQLARESLRIRTLLYDSNNQNVGISCNLRDKNTLGNEMKESHERSLVISIRNKGPDQPNIAVGYRNIALFYEQLAKFQTTADANRTQLLLVKSHFEKVWYVCGLLRQTYYGSFEKGYTFK
jgi:hypothetical protein